MDRQRVILESRVKQLCTCAKYGTEFVVQKWWECRTCNLINNSGCCTICAERCHRGHDVSFSRMLRAFCDCGEKGCKSWLPEISCDELCTYKLYGKEYISQDVYACVTCGLIGNSGCCSACAVVCHDGHQVLFHKYFTTFFCDCGPSGSCKCLNPRATIAVGRYKPSKPLQSNSSNHTPVQSLMSPPLPTNVPTPKPKLPPTQPTARIQPNVPASQKTNLSQSLSNLLISPNSPSKNPPIYTRTDLNKSAPPKFRIEQAQVGPNQTNEAEEPSKPRRKLRSLVKYNEIKKIINIEASTLDGIYLCIKRELSIKGQISLEYYDEGFKEYVTLDNIDDLNDSPKIQAIDKVETFASWDFSAELRAQTWQQKGYIETPYNSLCLLEGNSVYVKTEMQKLLQILSQFHNAPNLNIARAFAVDNRQLTRELESYSVRLSNKFRTNPQTFNMTQWKEHENAAWRAWMLTPLQEQINNSQWNSGTTVPVITMLQGTSEDNVWQIAQTGFAVVATRDEGWYGRGIYFTSHADYALYYAEPNSRGEKIITINYVVPGNVYPVCENPKESDSLSGKPCAKGYQSHYLKVSTNASTFGLPAKADETHWYDELVIFQESQVVLKYVVYVKK